MLESDETRTQEGTTIHRIARAKAWIFDVDGCIVRASKPGGDGGEPIPGAIELIRWLKDAGRKLIVCTNASQRPAAHYAAHLRSVGFDISDSEVMTAATAAAAYISRTHGSGPVIALGDAGLALALADEGVALVDKGKAPPVAVIVGAADQYLAKEISDACLAIADLGAAFYVTVDTPWFHGGIGRSVSSSTAIARAIQGITGRSPTVCGKPSPAIARVLSGRLGESGSDIVVVGDMASIEITMAREMGALGVLVLSGGTRADDVPDLKADQKPHLCIDDVGALLRGLQTEGERS